MTFSPDRALPHMSASGYRLPKLSNSPFRTPPINACHSPGVNRRTGPSASLLWRTPIRPSGRSATSTQLLLEKLRELLVQFEPEPDPPGSSRGIILLTSFTSLNVVESMACACDYAKLSNDYRACSGTNCLTPAAPASAVPISGLPRYVAGNVALTCRDCSSGGQPTGSGTSAARVAGPSAGTAAGSTVRVWPGSRPTRLSRLEDERPGRRRVERRSDQHLKRDPV